MSDTTPTHPPPQSDQEDRPPERASPKDGIVLSRADGRKDGVPVTYPSLPRRIEIYQAFRTAIGYRGDEEEPTGPYSEQDANAVLWAAVGACWGGRDVGLPDLRDCGRDVVQYGEAVLTALYFAGYCDATEIAEAGSRLMQDFVREALDARRRAAQGFQGAKRRR